MQFKSSFAAVGLAVALSVLQAAPAAAMLPPAGMIVFCQNNASHCRPDGTSKIAMSDNLLALMERVNTRVNRSIRPRNDPGFDQWRVGVSSGDCEDYVLTKRAQLIRSGVPAGALRIATTATRRGEPHAILVVKTSAGDFVLDNLSDTIRTVGASGYRIRSISTPNPMIWSAG